jgi:hypothetical protein
MKKIVKITAFVVSITITVITLTSGIEKSYGRSGGYKDLVDELYSQSVKQNKSLENIEDGIENFYKKKMDAIEEYNSFTAYNNRYYSDAKANTNTISNTTAKQKANELINKSEALYNTKIANWQSTIATLNANEKELNDLHTLLKLIITEPIIAKYQSTQLPENSKVKEAGEDLLKVIEKIRAITK